MNAQLPDQTGRTAIVTGGSSGIGRATVAALAALGARVIVAVRDFDRGRAAVDGLGGALEVRALDLASLASIRRFADGVTEPVDILINNAGTMTATRELTADGFERQLGVNHLGHFALTNLLLDRITGRVVSITSSAHRNAHIAFDDLHWERRPYHPFGAYGQSKLAVVLFTAELQRMLQAQGSAVIATTADPGWAATNFAVTTGSRLGDIAFRIGTRLMAQTAGGGARPTLLAAVGDVPSGALTAPRHFGVRGPATIAEPASAGNDPGTAARLWHVAEDLTATRPRR